MKIFAKNHPAVDVIAFIEKYVPINQMLEIVPI
jgi:hypothetical protein